MAKTIYHSKLTSESKTSPVEIKIISGPHESKYPRKPEYFVIEFLGEEYYYGLEKPGHANKLAPFVGQTIRAQFTGSGRDGSADIVVTGMDAPPPDTTYHPSEDDAPPGAEPPTRRAAAPAQPQDKDAKALAYHTAHQVGNVWMVAYLVAVEIQEIIGRDNMDDELFRNCITSITVNLHRTNLHTQLPTKLFQI